MKGKSHPAGKPRAALQPAEPFGNRHPPANSLVDFLLFCQASREAGNRPIIVLVRELDHFPAPQPPHIVDCLMPQFHATIEVFFVTRELPRGALLNSCPELPERKRSPTACFFGKRH